MSTPTPSDFAKRLTQQRQHESEREQQIADLEKKLSKSSSEKHDRTVKQNRARFGSGKERASSPRPSSRKGKVPATSSKSEAMKNHPAGKGRPSQDSRPASTTRGSRKDTARVKPESQSPSTSSQGNDSSKPSANREKKVFVRKPHLTQRLSDNEKLQELRDSFPKPRHQNRNTRSSSKRK